jgi:hypothetical protein
MGNSGSNFSKGDFCNAIHAENRSFIGLQLSVGNSLIWVLASQSIIVNISLGCESKGLGQCVFFEE